MTRHPRSVVITIACITAFGIGQNASAGQGCGCPGEITGDTIVNGTDLLNLLNDWGECNNINFCPADLNGDDIVDGADLLIQLNGWGQCAEGSVFNYGPEFEDSEALQIALEFTGGLLPTMEQYQRIETDLQNIRAEVPDLANQGHTPAWSPQNVIAQIDINATEGAIAEYECLKGFYEVVEDRLLFDIGDTEFRVLTTLRPINVEVLATQFAALDAVVTAEPDGLIGGQNFWMPTPLANGVWQWDIDDGYHDCFDGCDCHTFYVIETDARGNVDVISINDVNGPFCPDTK